MSIRNTMLFNYTVLVRSQFVLLISYTLSCIQLSEAVSMQNDQELIRFDALLKSPATGKTPSLGNIEEFVPDSAQITQCIHWFKQQGITVYPTEFGIAGETTKERFEELFGVQLIRSAAGSPGDGWHAEGELSIHPAVADHIDQTTFTARPELF